MCGAAIITSCLSFLRFTRRAALGVAILFSAALPIEAPAQAADELLAVTYNLHSGLGATPAFYRSRSVVERNLREVASSITRAGGDDLVDVVALNEVDFGSRRSGWVDQAAFLAEELAATTGSEYAVIRGETWDRWLPGLEVRFGNALLVRHPVVRAASCRLDRIEACDAALAGDTREPLPAKSFAARLLSEPRAVIKATIDFGGRPVDVLATHLDAFVQSEREAQATHLMSRFVRRGRTTVLLGDMNAVPRPLVRPLFATDRTAEILTAGSLADARAHFTSRAAGDWATFPSDRPLWPLDWILGSRDLVPDVVSTIGDLASDHRGLFARFRIRP